MAKHQVENSMLIIALMARIRVVSQFGGTQPHQRSPILKNSESKENSGEWYLAHRPLAQAFFEIA
jgi:hypothetical protein